VNAETRLHNDESVCFGAGCDRSHYTPEQLAGVRKAVQKFRARLAPLGVGITIKLSGHPEVVIQKPKEER